MARHQYNNPYPSVTQLISQLASPGLMNWYKVTPLAEINRISSIGKQIGTDTHLAIHYFIDTGKAKIETQYSDEVINALKSFMLFREENPNILFKNSEIALTSNKHLFNGQIDCLALRNEKDLLGDWKTQNIKEKEKPVIYEEAKIQCSAYCNLINECQNRDIQEAIIVALAKDKISYAKYEMGKDEIKGYFNEVFLPLLRIWYYRHKKDIDNSMN